jgi:hypothetical protein
MSSVEELEVELQAAIDAVQAAHSNDEATEKVQDAKDVVRFEFFLHFGF